MLVKFNQSAVFQMKIDVTKGFFKKKTVSETVYTKLSVARGVCDESEIDTKIQNGIYEWTKNFENQGYYDIVLCQDLKILKERYPYESISNLENCANFTPTKKSLSEMKVSEALETLNGKQFAQYCRENEIPFEKIFFENLLKNS